MNSAEAQAPTHLQLRLSFPYQSVNWPLSPLSDSVNCRENQRLCKIWYIILVIPAAPLVSLLMIYAPIKTPWENPISLKPCDRHTYAWWPVQTWGTQNLLWGRQYSFRVHGKAPILILKWARTHTHTKHLSKNGGKEAFSAVCLE